MAKGKKDRRYKLSALTFDEVSLVDRPANPGAQVLLYKRSTFAAPSGKQKGKSTMSMLEIIKSHLAAAGTPDDQIETIAKEMLEEIGEVVTKAEHDAAVAKASEDAKAAAEAEHAKTFEKKVEEEVTKRVAEESESDEEKLKKGMTPEQLEEFEKQQTALKAAEERIAKVEAERKAEKITKRLEAFSNVIKVEEVTPLIAKLEDEDAAAIEAVLEKASKQVAEADKLLTKASGHKQPAEGTAEAELNSTAEEIAKRDGITFHQAFRKACENNPALLKRYRSEQSSN